nr:hypothetical protein Iba_chr02bCG2860 [Ipomoea batatas]
MAAAAAFGFSENWKQLIDGGEEKEEEEAFDIIKIAPVVAALGLLSSFRMALESLSDEPSLKSAKSEAVTKPPPPLKSSRLSSVSSSCLSSRELLVLLSLSDSTASSFTVIRRLFFSVIAPPPPDSSSSSPSSIVWNSLEYTWLGSSAMVGQMDIKAPKESELSSDRFMASCR